MKETSKVSLKSIIPALRVSHQSILSCIEQIQSSTHTNKSLKPGLKELELQLYSYFETQNVQSYEYLSNLYSDDKEKSKIIEFLIQNLKEIKVKALIFFDQHPADMSNSKSNNFFRDFSNFNKEIFARINAETQFFIPLLEQIVI